MSTDTQKPHYPENNIEIVLAFPKKEKAMEGLLATMEDVGLWNDERSQRFGKLGILYWKTNCDGLQAAVDLLGEMLGDALLLLKELEAVKTAAALEELLTLFPNEWTSDGSDIMEITDQMKEADPELFERFQKRFLDSFFDDDHVLLRLHGWVSANPGAFPPRKQSKKGKWVQAN